MSNNTYYVYGLRVHAEIACPELPYHPQPDGNPDVTIRLLPPLTNTSEPLESGCYEVRPGVFRLAVKGVGRFLVEEGRRITIEPLAGSSTEEVRLFLLGSVIGALLYQRGLFPLHGSAIETRWGAMIFVGAQGIGKSTLAAQFYRRGYHLLSDDVCAVAARDGELVVLPALAHFRLCADAYERLNSNPDAPAPDAHFHDARFNVDKFVVPMNDGYCRDPVPLKAIHVLADQEEGDPQFEFNRGFDRVQRLFENLYRPQYLKGQETQSDLMRLAGQIAQKISMATVSRRRDPETIDQLIDFLESAWAAHFGSNSREEHK